MKKKATKAKRLVVGKSDAANVQLRDYFAAMALSGMLANASTYRGWSDRVAETKQVPSTDLWRVAVSEAAYDYADAMLAAREAKP